MGQRMALTMDDMHRLPEKKSENQTRELEKPRMITGQNKRSCTPAS